MADIGAVLQEMQAQNLLVNAAELQRRNTETVNRDKHEWLEVESRKIETCEGLPA